MDFYSKYKGVIFMSKVFRKSVDGEFEEGWYEGRKLYARQNRAYLRVRLEDIMKKETGSPQIRLDYFMGTDDVYAVVARVKKGSRQYDVLKKLGFTENDEEES